MSIVSAGKVSMVAVCMNWLVGMLLSSSCYQVVASKHPLLQEGVSRNISMNIS